jgi:hypothetical protein
VYLVNGMSLGILSVGCRYLRCRCQRACEFKEQTCPPTGGGRVCRPRTGLVIAPQTLALSLISSGTDFSWVEIRDAGEPFLAKVL